MRAASEIEERLGTLKQQAGKAATAINKIAGKASPALSSIIPTAAFGTDLTPAMEAVKPFPHLLIIQPLKTGAKPYYFNLDTAAFEELVRSTEFRWASQERLTRRPAQQAIGMGSERITLKGAIYPGFKGGLKQLDTLRSIGAQLQPLGLTTGYGDVLGNWCLKKSKKNKAPSCKAASLENRALPWSLYAMATTCRTASGDVLDTLCQNYYGHLIGTVKAVLDANQGLTDEVQPYRAGVVIFKRC